MDYLKQNKSIRLLERVIAVLSPGWAAKREMGRIAYHQSMAASSYYRGASKNRLDRSWFPSSQQFGMSGPVGSTLKQMRDRSRHLIQNNPLASSLLNSMVNVTVLSGMTLQALTDDESFNDEAEEIWGEFWHGRPEITGRFTGPDLERMIATAYHRDGDLGAILLSRETKLQMVEGDLVVTPVGQKIDRDRVIDGVEFSERGTPIAYWVSSPTRDSITNAKRISAKDFIFLARNNRFNQVRGIPVFSSTFGLFDQLDGYIESTVVAARMASSIGLLITKSGAAQAFGALPGRVASDGKEEKQFSMQPGMVKYLEEGETATQINPNHPSTHFASLVRELTRMVSLEMGQPLELSIMDFTKTNFSQSKAIVMMSGLSSRAYQDRVRSTFMSRVYRWLISKAVNDGRFKSRVPGRFWDHRFVAPKMPLLDHIEQAQLDQFRIDTGQSSLRQVHRDLNINTEKVLQERADELRLRDQLDIPLMRSTLSAEVAKLK